MGNSTLYCEPIQSRRRLWSTKLQHVVAYFAILRRAFVMTNRYHSSFVTASGCLPLACTANRMVMVAQSIGLLSLVYTAG